jgi:predicted ester cyclase
VPHPTPPREGIDLDALLALWETPPADRADAVADFSRLYADPVVVNGAPMSVAQLVARAAAFHQAFCDSTTEVLDVVTEGPRIAFAFRRRATHVGPWPTPLGDVPATGRRVTLTGMDILTVTDGRVTGITVLADDLPVLLGAVGHRL